MLSLGEDMMFPSDEAHQVRGSLPFSLSHNARADIQTPGGRVASISLSLAYYIVRVYRRCSGIIIRQYNVPYNFIILQ